MLGEGMKVRFVPNFADSEKFTPGERRAAQITGEIVFINYEHGNFCVEFDTNGSKQRETFLFRDVGQAVSVIG
jgi:hypothetical protein